MYYYSNAMGAEDGHGYTQYEDFGQWDQGGNWVVRSQPEEQPQYGQYGYRKVLPNGVDATLLTIVDDFLVSETKGSHAREGASAGGAAPECTERSAMRL